MRIYFTRHGESQANVLHEISNRGLRHGLTNNGRQQAAALAQRLERHPIERIYSSPLLRAIETSVLLANHLSVDYEVTDALREADCGVLEGRSDKAAWEEWKKLFKAWMVHRDWDQRIDGGESLADLRGRFEPFVQSLVQEYGETETELVCVSHGGVCWSMLPLVLKNVDLGLVAGYGFDYVARIIAEWRPTGLYCVEWNGHAIEEPADTR
jgi:broad specificity phosphatase PhoE